MPLSTVWESLKAYLRGQIISYCANKKRRSSERLRLLTDEILLVDREYSHFPSPDLVKKRMSLQTEFNTLSTQQAEYLISKSRHGYYEHGEKAGRLLAHQLRQRSVTQNIPAIINGQGNQCSDNEKINSCFSQFYQSLYSPESSSNQSDLETFFEGINVPFVSPDLAD